MLFCPWDFPGKNTGVGCHFSFSRESSQPRGQTWVFYISWKPNSGPASVVLTSCIDPWILWTHKLWKEGKVRRLCHLYYPSSSPSDISAIELLWNFRIRRKTTMCNSWYHSLNVCAGWLSDVISLNSPRNLLILRWGNWNSRLSDLF